MSAVARDIRLPPTSLPEPDYSDTSSDDDGHQMAVRCKQINTSEEGLILPRKLVNPCMESAERRELHRELIFNNKIGKNVLGQKSELQKAMERHKDLKERRQAQLSTHKSSFEAALEERLLRLEGKAAAAVAAEAEEESAAQVAPPLPEFLQVHAKVRSNVGAAPS